MRGAYRRTGANHGGRYGKPGRDAQRRRQDRCDIGAAPDKAGLCYLLSGELTVVALSDLKTEDGKRIVVTARRKTTAPRQGGPS